MSPGRAVLAGALVWLVAALWLGGAGALLGLRPAVLLLLVASLALVLVAASWLVPTLRRFARSADFRVLAGFHLVRFLGLHFVILGMHGLLPALFVLFAGYGNLVVAALALVSILLVRPGSRGARAWWLGWNLLGLLVGFAVGAVVLVVGRTNPDALRAFLVLPLSLVPSFVAPIALATHVWMIVRLVLVPLPPRATLRLL